MRGLAGWMRLGAVAVAFAAGVYCATPARAADIIADWPNVKLPPAPKLKSATLDDKTTALLILDMQRPACAERPLCVESIPKVKALLEQARAAGSMVFYSLPGGKASDIIDPGLAPHEGEWLPISGPDKFFGSDLDKRLKDRGIKTVIVCGTSAQGVGIGTGSAAVQRGYKVIYPVDCLSSESPFRELYAAYHMSGGGPPVTTKFVTVTRSDMIKFQNAP